MNSGITWIGEIPNHWSLERLQWHITEIKHPNDPIQTSLILSLTNKRGVIPYVEKGDQGNRAKENLTDYKLAYPGTIVANSMNILIGSVGKCDYFGCVSPVYYVFKPNDGENIDFLTYIFQSEPFQKELRRFANGILEIRLRVSSQDILKRPIAFPDSQEQIKIVNFLNRKCSEIDSLIAVEEAQIEKLNEYKQSIIRETLFSGLDSNCEKRHSGIDWIGEIPTNWRLCRIKNLFVESAERNESLNFDLLVFSSSKGLIPHKDFTDKLPSAEDLSNYKIIRPGELLMNRMQAWHGMFIDSKISGCVSPDYAVYLPKKSEF